MAGLSSQESVGMGRTEVRAEALEGAELANSPVASGEAVADTRVEAPRASLAPKSTTTPVFNRRPMHLQEKFSTPPLVKAGTPPLPRASPVLTERNGDLGGRRPNALQLPPKNFMRHQERWVKAASLSRSFSSNLR